MILRREDGSAAVEFAFVLPILLMILLGIMEFGIILYRQEVITNASREGARFGIIIGSPRPTTGQIQDVVSTYLTSAGLTAGDASIDVTGAQGASGDDLTVAVTYPYTFIALPNFVARLSSSLALNATTVMKQE